MADPVTFTMEAARRVARSVRFTENFVDSSKRRRHKFEPDFDHPFKVVAHDTNKADIRAGPVEVGGRGFWWFTGSTDVVLSGSGWLLWSAEINNPSAGGVAFQTNAPDPQNDTYYLRTIAKVTMTSDGNYEILQCQFSGIAIYATVQ